MEDDISLLVMQRDLVFDEETQPIEMDISPISGVLKIAIVGYGGRTRMLRYFMADAFLCGTNHKLLCTSTATEKTSIDSANARGPLLQCNLKAKICRQIGVAIAGNSTYSIFASMHVQADFIKKYVFKVKSEIRGSYKDCSRFTEPSHAKRYVILASIFLFIAIVLAVGI